MPEHVADPCGRLAALRVFYEGSAFLVVFDLRGFCEQEPRDGLGSPFGFAAVVAPPAFAVPDEPLIPWVAEEEVRAVLAHEPLCVAEVGEGPAAEGKRRLEL